MTETIPVNPSRLTWGEFWNGAKRECCSGDIHEAYSADRISEGKPIRQPFRFNGEMWCNVGMSGAGGIEEAKAYRLTALALFKGTPTTYSKKVNVDCGEAARGDPLGFYDSIRVMFGRDAFILTGPEVRFVADPEAQRPEDAVQENAQLSLFI
jgi:hypothetical protein